MARKTIGAWIRQALGANGAGSKQGPAGASPYMGKQVITNEGIVLGTVTAMWRGTDATDHSSHEDTLGVQRPEQDRDGLLYIPSSAIARESAQGIVLTVDESQVGARGWRFRPEWLPQDANAGTQAW